MCGDYQVKLFGNGESMFEPAELSYATPSLLSFGARYCGGASSIELGFQSLLDGRVHRFRPGIGLPGLPSDDQRHTYRLDWSTSSDHYSIFVDGERRRSGKITGDFDGFGEAAETGYTQSKPSSRGGKPYQVDEEVLAQLQAVDKYLPDPDAEIPPYTNVSEWTPPEIVNPEFERLYAAYESM